MIKRGVGTIAGRKVDEAVLSDGPVWVSLLSHGAILRDWRLPDGAGRERSVTLGFDDIARYGDNIGSLGIVAGRVANRIREGRFALDGVHYQLDRNRGPHHLHGGREGFGTQNFALEAEGREARLTLHSPDGAMGYPGAVDVTLRFILRGHSLTFDMTAVPDRPTPIALAQHSYYRLGAHGSDHTLTIPADRTTVVDAQTVPTGAFAPVAGTALDFRQARRIGNAFIDTNFCLTGAPAATLATDTFALTMETDRPGLQVFSGGALPTFPVAGHEGVIYGPLAGIALEAQDFPDAVNHAAFGDVIATPEKPYRQVTTVTIAPTRSR
ncbi:MAG: aldose epimerase family protein [Pseudomonadota bacterium]